MQLAGFDGPLRLIGAHIDVTERKETEAQLRLLMQELAHRVKNTLAMIQAIAFYLFAFLVIASGVLTIMSRNPVHSVLCLILAFFNAAGLMVLDGRALGFDAPSRRAYGGPASKAPGGGPSLLDVARHHGGHAP